jgi:hypothetical protein
VKTPQIAVLPGLSSFSSADIFEVVYNDDGLKVRLGSDENAPTILFDAVVGFRLLDEGDLLEFWSSAGFDANGSIYVVNSGGWLDLESSRSGFLSKEREGLVEYLITTACDCLNVLSFESPTIVPGAT